MSSNSRQKPTKNRLSLRKKCTTKISKSPRRSQPSLGLNQINPLPIPLQLNSNSSATHIPPIQNIINNNQKYTTIKPKIIVNKHWKSPTTPHEHILDNSNMNNNNENDDDSICELFETKPIPPTNICDNLSAGSSISDILNTMASHEDSDDEAATKAMFHRLDDLNLHKNNNNNNNNIRKIQSNPAISNMNNNNNNNNNQTAHNLFSNNNTKPINKQIITKHIKLNETNIYTKSTCESPSSAISSDSQSHCTQSEVIIKSVPEENAIIKCNDGLMTYIGKDKQCTNYINEINNNNNNMNNITRTRSVSSFKHSHHTSHHRKHKGRGLNRRIKGSKHQKNIGKQQQATNNNNNQIQNNNNENMRANNNNSIGVICEMNLQSEWDCLTVSSNQEWVALFSRNSMALLNINEYGQFEQLRDLKAGRKESRLKYGAVDAEFYWNDINKLISCTRNGTLIVLNLNFKGRGCIALSDCKLKQRVHKVTWIRNTSNVLAAAEDGNCYLWDTRVEGTTNSNVKSFSNNKCSALNVRMSPFNDELFASSHKNGTINIWDIRNEKCPFLTITAHKSSINCIDWHPAIPNVMASCGYRDITIKIWNLTDDNVAQNKYYSFWNKLNRQRSYNSEDDYRMSYSYENNNIMNGYKPISSLSPNCSMYPSGYVSQIGWRPCSDASSLSANQIACSYVDSSQQVVEMWDIKSSYVPVARMNCHESETKFKFIFKNKPFKTLNENERDNNNKRERTYLITCSKDKSIKLHDCSFADIPRSHLSSCALDIAPFGNTCFVSVPRQKLHPFDQETYHIKNNSNQKQLTHKQLRKSSSMGELRKDSIDLLQSDVIEEEEEEEQEEEEENIKIKRRSYSGNINNFDKDLNKKNSYIKHINHRSMTVVASDSECIIPSPINKIGNKNKNKSKNSGGLFALFSKRNNNNNKREQQQQQQQKQKQQENNRNNNVIIRVNDSRETINAMSNGYKTSKLNELLAGIFNHNFDAFSIFETKLTCYPIKELNNNNISPCDNAITFKYLAKNYKLTGQSIHLICKQNENVCKYIGNIQLTHLWNLLSILLQNIPSTHTHKRVKKNKRVKNTRINNIQIEYESDSSSSYTSNSYLSISHNNNISSNEKPLTPPLKILQNALNNYTSTEEEEDLISEDEEENDIQLISSYICDIINENISRGDIQTAVTIIIILKEYINKYFDEYFLCDIILSYLQLLLHSKLLIESVKIYQLTKNYKLIENYFLTKHRLIIKCIRCKEIMRDYRCFKCNKIARCNACNESLIVENKLLRNNNKLLIWCQICGHGGHFNHMKNWFRNKKICNIENCKHICQPVLIQLNTHP